jgi:hypothetical protein
MTGKIITGTAFVILASTSAFCEEPGPSAAPSPPPVLAQSPPAGVIEAATPAPTPVPTPALSPSATPGVAQASPTTETLRLARSRASATPIIISSLALIISLISPTMAVFTYFQKGREAKYALRKQLTDTINKLLDLNIEVA